MSPRADIAATAVGVVALASIGVTATLATGVAEALVVPALFVVAGLVGPVWQAAVFVCRLLVAIGAAHLIALCLSSVALSTADAVGHSISLVLFVAGFALFVPLAAGYPTGPGPRWSWIVVATSCLVPVAASFAGPTPAVLGGELLGPIAEALPPVVASAAGVVFALPLVAVAVTLVRMARGGRELRGRLTLPLAALAAVALLVAAGAALPAGLSTALFLVAAPQLPIALIAGSRPIHVVTSTGDTTRTAAAQNVSGEQIASLTPRERDVLGLMAQGQSNPAIGRSLHISLSAVEKHSTAIFSKLDLPIEPDTHRRVSAVVAYLRAASDA